MFQPTPKPTMSKQDVADKINEAIKHLDDLRQAFNDAGVGLCFHVGIVIPESEDYHLAVYHAYAERGILTEYDVEDDILLNIMAHLQK